MKAFLQSRLRFRGELHEVRLVNFSVEKAELTDRLPSPLSLRNFGDRALISMVDVQLRQMRLTQMPLLRFNYRHLAFRLLVEDAHWNPDGQNHGIHFLQSFTNRPLLAAAGNAMSLYQFESAKFTPREKGIRFEQGEHWLEYQYLDQPKSQSPAEKKVFEMVRSIDRAWSVAGNQVLQTRIMREHWPIQAVQPIHFRTNFFETARLESVYIVPHLIHYEWLPAQALTFQSELNPQNTAYAFS